MFETEVMSGRLFFSSPLFLNIRS